MNLKPRNVKQNTGTKSAFGGSPLLEIWSLFESRQPGGKNQKPVINLNLYYDFEEIKLKYLLEPEIEGGNPFTLPGLYLSSVKSQRGNPFFGLSMYSYKVENCVNDPK